MRAAIDAGNATAGSSAETAGGATQLSVRCGMCSCRSIGSYPMTAEAEECELAFQQFSGFSRRLKGCFPESSNNGRLLSDDISVVRMTNLGGQL